MTAEELVIWAIVSVALLLVAAMIWRGEAMPTIETHQENHPYHRHTELGRYSFDERAWLASNRYLRKETVKSRGEDQEFRPGSPADFKSLTRGLATGEPAKSEAKPATNTVVTTAIAPAKDDAEQDETKKDDVAAKLPAPAAPATVQPAAEPADPATSEVAIKNPDRPAVKGVTDKTF